jgi:hypothetical protein
MHERKMTVPLHDLRQVEQWNTRPADAREVVAGLVEASVSLNLALAMHTSLGYPSCPGDCSSANPPMLSCPTQEAKKAYAKFDAALTTARAWQEQTNV